MATTPMFEARLEPKDVKASIECIYVRIDDPVNITDIDKLLGFLETQFPHYYVVHVIAGYKQVIDSDSIPE